MNDFDYISIIIIYILILCIIVLTKIIDIRKSKRKIKMIDFLDFYYILIFFITPILCLIQIRNGTMSTYQRNLFMTTDARYFLIVLLLAIIGYIFIHLGYRIKIIGKGIKNIDVKNKKFFMVSVLLMCIGTGALLLWTKAYGMPWDIFPYASQIRSGVVEIYNPFTFVKPFCYFSVIATYNFIIIWESKKWKLNFSVSLCLAISIFSSIIFLIANDGRMLMLIYVLVPLIYFLLKRKRKIPIVKLAIISILMLLIVGNIDKFTYLIRNHEKSTRETNDSISSIIVDEFSYTYSNSVNFLYMKEKGIIQGFTELNDLYNIIFSWIPERFTPDNVVTLFERNTSYYDNASGTLPTDLITASLYKFGYIGIFIIPVLVGILIRILDEYFQKNTDSFKEMFFILVSIYLPLRLVAYYDLSNILFGCFYIIISYILVIMSNKNRGGKIENECTIED